MAVVMRLKRLGTKRKPHSRIIICESKRARDTRIIDNIGFYDPTKNPALVQVNKSKAKKWLSSGARPSETVRSILKKQGVI